MNKKIMILIVGMFFLIGALVPMSLAKNFNITSNGNDLSQGDDLVYDWPFYVDGSNGNFLNSYEEINKRRIFINNE